MKKCILALFILGFTAPVNAQLMTKQDFLGNSYTLYPTQHEQDIELKNKNIATLLSLGSTIASYYISGAIINIDSGNPLLALTSLFVIVSAPSAGYLYSGNNDDFWRNTLHRTIAIGTATTGLVILLVNSFDSIFSDNEASNSGANLFASILFIGGTSWFFISTVRDFIVVRNKVDEYNQNLLNRVQIAPIVDPVHKTAGVGLRVNL